MQIVNCWPTALISTARIGLIIITLLASNVLVPNLSAQTDAGPATSSVEISDGISDGLKGLLPDKPPSSLTDQLERFPANWATWTSGLESDLNALYLETPTDVTGQRAALARIKRRLRTIDICVADARYNPIRADLLELRGRLARHIEVLEAVLDTLIARESPTYTDWARQRTLASLNGLDAFLDGATGGQRWKPYLRTAEVRRELMSGTKDMSSLNALKTSLRKLGIVRGSKDSTFRDLSEMPPFKNYYIDLYRVVAAFELNTGGIKWNDVRSELKALLEELDRYEENNLLSSAGQVRAIHDRLRSLTPQGGERLTAVLRQHYFNSNFRAAISEGFLNRLMATSRVESGGVRDYILGADVYGGQTTATQSSVNLLPANLAAHLQIQLSGNGSTSTEAIASKATIYSVGSNHFDGFKDVFFNGISFSTAPAIVNVSASNQPYSASTRADGIPIFAGIARRIALRTANRNRPEAEAIAAQRVDSRVSPRFNAEVDSAFARLNWELQNKVGVRLRSEQLYPDYIASMSTNSELILNTRLMSEGKLGGGVAPRGFTGADDVLFSFHESLLNNAIDLLPLAGMSMTELEFQQLVGQKMTQFFPKLKLPAGSGPKSATDAGEPKRIMFAEQDPVRVRFEDGKILLTIRAGFERDEEQGGNIPPQIMTIPWTTSVTDNSITVTRGDIAVESMMNDNVAQQVLLAGIIGSRLAKSFPETATSARMFKIDRPGKASLRLWVTEMTIQNGWLSIRVSP